MRQFSFALVLLAGLSQICTTSAVARGTVVIQQNDGSVRRYPNAWIHIVGKTLRLTSADKKGTLIITDAACSYVEKLLRCYPYSALLRQNGDKPITVASGTIYLNPTNETQPLKYTSTKVPANGVLAIMRTDVGTYVSVNGTMDGRTR